MLSHSTTTFALIVTAYTLVMACSFARAFYLYFANDGYWTASASVGGVMLLLMVMSLML